MGLIPPVMINEMVDDKVEMMRMNELILFSFKIFGESKIGWREVQ